MWTRLQMNRNKIIYQIFCSLVPPNAEMALNLHKSPYRPVLNVKRKFRKYFSSKINDFQHTSLYYAAHFSPTNMNLYFLFMVLIIFHSPQTKPPIAITRSQMTSRIFCWKKWNCYQNLVNSMLFVNGCQSILISQQHESTIQIN